MVIPADRLKRAKQVLMRGGLLIVLLAVLLFVPGPSGALGIMLFETLLLIIFCMLAIGLTGPGLHFVALSALGVTVLFPVLLQVGLVTSQTGDLIGATVQVYQVLTERDQLAALYLLVPSVVASLLAWQLGRHDFRLRPK